MEYLLYYKNIMPKNKANVCMTIIINNMTNKPKQYSLFFKFYFL